MTTAELIKQLQELDPAGIKSIRAWVPGTHYDVTNAFVYRGNILIECNAIQDTGSAPEYTGLTLEDM